jgi:hypothetical protein
MRPAVEAAWLAIELINLGKPHDAKMVLAAAIALEEGSEVSSRYSPYAFWISNPCWREVSNG